MSYVGRGRGGRAMRTFFPSFGVGIGVLLGSVLTSISGSGAPGPSSLDVVDLTVVPVASFLGCWILLALGDVLLGYIVRGRAVRSASECGDAEQEQRESAQDQ